MMFIEYLLLCIILLLLIQLLYLKGVYRSVYVPSIKGMLKKSFQLKLEIIKQKILSSFKGEK
ncbi:MAG: hypothetical protein C0446_08390 [Chitinophaga sp.]|nr:hypothetical protein [Chitinophaga sp.]